MPELRESLSKGIQGVKHRVEQGRDRLVRYGSARAPREHKQYEITEQPVELDSEDKPLIITATGVAAVDQQAARKAAQQMQRKPEEHGISSIVRTVWKRSLFGAYFEERFRLYDKEVYAAIKNDVLNDERIAQATAHAETKYQDELRRANIAKRAGRRSVEFIKSAIGKKTLIQQYTLDELRAGADVAISEATQREVGQVGVRFSQAADEQDKAIRKGMGEDLRILSEGNDEEREILTKGRKLLTDYAANDAFTEDQFQQSSRELWTLIKNLRPEAFKAADFYVSSLYETAKALRVQRQNGISLSVIEDRVKRSEWRIAFGVMGTATDMEISDTRKIAGKIEKTVSRFEKTPLGAGLLNEATIGGAVGLGLSALLIPRSAVTSAARLIAPIGGSIVGGAFGAVREFRRLGRERKIHIGEKEMGLKVDQGKQREWFEKYNVPQKTAAELSAALQLPDAPTADDLRNFAGNIANAQAMIDISSRKVNRLGLVTFSSPQMIESERTQLFQAMREARKKFERVDAGALQTATGSTDTAQEFLRKVTELRTNELNNAINEANQRFNRGRAVKAAKYGVTAAGVGMAAGEVVADTSHFISTGHVDAVGPIGQILRPILGGPQTAFEELATRAKIAAPEKVVDTFNKAVGEMGKTHGLRGPWGWLEEPMRDHANAIAHHVPATNLAKNLFRGWEENVQGQHVDYTRLPNNFVFKDLPKGLFGDETLPKIGHIMDEAIKIREIDHVALGSMDELHKLAYEIGRIGRIPTAEEVRRFMELVSPAAPAEAVVSHVATETFASPPIPIGFHAPLEGLEGIVAASTPVTPIPFRPYGAEVYEDEARRKFSPKIKENPDYIPDPTYEIPRYLNEQHENNEYWSELEKLDRQVPTQMHSDCEAVASLAVAGHQEHNNIYRTLETYATQVNSKGESIWLENQFEINLLVNWPKGQSPEKTLKEIARFKADHPEVRINTYQYEVTNGKKELGFYKKMVFDLALLRASKRPGPVRDIAIIMNDADMTFTNVHYLDGMVKILNDPQYRAYDAILGRQDLDPEVYDKYPTFHAGMSFLNIMAAVDRATGRVDTQGRNTAIRGASYAAIGGNRTKAFWADIEFGWLLKKARADKNTVLYTNANWVMVDPRRELSKFLQGEPIGYTWINFDTHEVRGKKIDLGQYTDVDVHLLNASDPNNPEIERFDKRLKQDIDSILRIFGPRIETDSEFRDQYIQLIPGATRSMTGEELIARALKFLGVEATVDKVGQEGFFEINFVSQKDASGRLMYTGTEKLRQSLLQYEQEERWNTKIKNHPLFSKPKTP